MKCIRSTCSVARYLAGIYCHDCREHIVIDTRAVHARGNPHNKWALAERRRRMKLQFRIEDRFVYRLDEEYAA